MGTVLSAGKYISWGVVEISVTNLLIIVLMVVIFVLALVIPFPHGGEPQRAEPPARDESRQPDERQQP